ncbi:EamA-like transporter family protein [Desulfofundulus thermobenzoicus]|uniref:EamA-like transporter family protein n=1 Tax=Desulfofundulus thermobenzoicus TaxID=29376 RepID=A0A6N7IUP2_9FIRM|nr:DMT family transporter [Desulfofundulus thermobenzoicus]MQL53229.1 EamA-like transporter family protein [Desulfofundulus thermobenzoicus]HHW43544.1 DMT family transporter [Desulfotomaculum sp.]
MSVRLLALVIAALSGVIMAVQGSLDAALGKIIGLLETTFVVHLVGLVVVAVLLFGLRLGDGQLANYAQAPWYYYLGGVLGVLIIYGVVRSIPKVGVAPATTAIIVGQVLTASLIDHLGLFGLEKLPFTWYRLLGTLLMAGGAWMLLKK